MTADLRKPLTLLAIAVMAVGVMFARGANDAGGFGVIFVLYLIFF